MRRYIVDSASVSAGVFIHFSSVGANSRPMTVISAPPATAIMMPVCTARETPSFSSAP